MRSLEEMLGSFQALEEIRALPIRWDRERFRF